MSTLTDRILKLAEFEPCEISKTNNQFKHGRTNENTRLLPLIKSLAQIIQMQSEALEHTRQILADHYNGEIKLSIEDYALGVAEVNNVLADTQARLKELGIE